MSKSIQIMAIAVAFVAVTLISGVVYADDKNGKPFEAIWEAIHSLESTPTNGITNVYQKDNPQLINSPAGLSLVDVKATCNPDDIVLGGGYENTHGFPITADEPFEDGDKQGWLVTFSTSSVIPKAVNVHAICAIP
jgi:hypothetical protein